MNVGVVGAGSIGRRHAANLRALDHDVVLADLDADLARRVAAELDAHAADEGSGLPLHDLDAVVVCTPPGSHAVHAVAALDAGCHILVEKPVAHTLPDARAIQAAHERSEATAMVACNMRFHPGPAAAKQAVGSGVLGDVLYARIHCGSYLPRWRPGTDHRASYSADPKQGGAVLDCIHELDLAQWYLGPARLAGSVVRPGTSVSVAADGLAELLLEHRGPDGSGGPGGPGGQGVHTGPVSSVHLNFIQRDYRRSCQIVGTEGTFTWDFSEGRTKRYGPDGELAAETDVATGWDVNDMYVAQLEHFLAHARAGTPPMNGPSEAEATLALALEARR